jgi:hypothetical protein
MERGGGITSGRLKKKTAAPMWTAIEPIAMARK